jgi:hypothetical protein
MNALQHNQTNRGPIMWLAVGLALLATLSYLLIQLGALGVGDLRPAEMPAVIVYVAASGYLLGGLLILARRRWLWMVGAVINALVILFFVLAYLHRPAVLFPQAGWSPSWWNCCWKGACSRSS